jgi:hypothetical protein
MQATAIHANRLYREAAEQARSVRRDAAAGPKATVRTRSMGVDLGFFGLSYTERNVEFESESAARAEALKAAAYRAETEVAGLREDLRADLGASPDQAAARARSSGSTTPRLDALLGRRAYARAAQNTPPPRPSFGVV